MLPGQGCWVWSLVRNWIPHAATESSYATTKESTCHNKRLKILGVAAKTQCNQINNVFFNYVAPDKMHWSSIPMSHFMQGYGAYHFYGILAKKHLASILSWENFKQSQTSKKITGQWNKDSKTVTEYGRLRRHKQLNAKNWILYQRKGHCEKWQNSDEVY